MDEHIGLVVEKLQGTGYVGLLVFTKEIYGEVTFERLLQGALLLGRNFRKFLKTSEFYSSARNYRVLYRGQNKLNYLSRSESEFMIALMGSIIEQFVDSYYSRGEDYDNSRDPFEDIWIESSHLGFILTGFKYDRSLACINAYRARNRISDSGEVIRCISSPTESGYNIAPDTLDRWVLV